jgi:hypothetical protein
VQATLAPTYTHTNLIFCVVIYLRILVKIILLNDEKQYGGRAKQFWFGSVGIALGYGLDDRDSRVRFPAGAGNFSLHHRVQNGSDAYPASYPMDTRGSFLGGKAAGA